MHNLSFNKYLRARGTTNALFMLLREKERLTNSLVVVLGR